MSGPVDDAHSALAELLDGPVRTDPRGGTIPESYFFLGGSMYRPSVSTIFLRSSTGLIFPFAL